MKFVVKMDLPGAEELIRKKGIGPGGRVQMFHTANVGRRIEKYIPKQTGNLRRVKYKTSTQITFSSPYAKYQYYGKVMKGKAPRVVTGKNLNYQEGGPFWDRALVADEGEVLREELQAFINRGGGA